MNRLAQHLNGLRGGTRLQYDLIKSGVVECAKMSADNSFEGEGEETATIQSADAFGHLFGELGPPLKELSTTCTSSLLRMRQAFLNSQRGSQHYAFEQHEFFKLVDGIERALQQFESTSNDAVLCLYRRSGAESIDSADTDGVPILSGTDNEHVFVVYFFIFTLQEFATELVSLVDAMCRIYSLEQAQANRPRWWRIFCWPQRRCRPRTSTPRSSLGLEIPKTSALQRRLPKIMIPVHRRTHPSFPKVRPHAPNTMQTPAWERLTWIGKIKQHLWTIGRRFTESDIKYAIKAGMATALLAAPAFFETTRPIFLELWGHWALISVNRSIRAKSVLTPGVVLGRHFTDHWGIIDELLSLHRVLGTVFGAAVAAVVYIFFPDNPIVLSIFGSASRLVFLTYNLICLFCYNLRGHDVSPVNVAIRRVIAVTVGVVWAALVSRFRFCVNTGWLYTRLVASNSYSSASRDMTTEGNGGSDSETQALSPEHAKLRNSIKEFMAMSV
ncbi:ArAE-2 domain-containing protein [Mycena venus]|uniref:ArAE-2 domain-containing protein n=1 Tax=Mycena venus TaxID=2733690 RepID=A0A8H6X5X2_9AGAR|nr:ArAE-2 domain-containing protein [Mycena venus]